MAPSSGIEFGSTRIKASLIAPDTTPLASGSHAWENQLQDGVWTYDLEDVWTRPRRLLRVARRGRARPLRRRAARPSRPSGISGMMHGYVALDREGELLVPFRTWRNNITGQACAELTPLLDFAVPQRWSIAHLYQSILDGAAARAAARPAHDARRLRPLAAHRRAHAGRRTRHPACSRSTRARATGTPHGWRSSTPSSRRATSAGRCATSCPTSCPPVASPAGSPPRARSCSTRRARFQRGHSALPARGRRGHGHGRHQRRAAALGQRLGRDVGVRDDRAREEPVAGARGDRHRGHARRQARGDGPLQQRLLRPRRLDRAVRPGRQGARRRGDGRTSSTSSFCRSRWRATRTRAGCSRSTTSRAST